MPPYFLRYLSYLLVGFLVVSLPAQVAGQERTNAGSKGTIFGKIIDDASHAGVESASIAVYVDGNSRPIGGAMADARGNFTISGLEPGRYRVVVDFIGYESMTVMAEITASNKSVTLEDISLLKKSQTLQNVVVVAQKPLVVNKIDKMVYNAEKDVTAQGGVATDLLRKIPQVSVDVDGNVELQGNSNIRFLINGKPSSIFGNSLADALQSIPASQIKTIEVITNPGPKYDAEGTGGIINIVLKDNRIRGINGNVNLSVGTRLENGSLNVRAREGKFSVNGYFSGNGQIKSTTVKSLERYSYDTTGQLYTHLLQDGSSDFTRKGMNAGAGFEYEISKKTSITGGFGYSQFSNESGGTNNQESIIATMPVPGNILTDVKTMYRPHNRFNVQSYDYNLNFRQQFKEDQELTMQLNSSYGVSGWAYSQQQFGEKGDSLFSGMQSANRGNNGGTEFRIDYTQPIKPGVKFETGVKGSWMDIKSASDVYSLGITSPDYKYDSAQSNNLDYKRQVYAAYGMIGFPVGKWLEVKTGLRYEWTSTEAHYSQASNVSIPGYSTLAPSLLLAHHFGDNQTLKFSYSRRIQRPDYELLNPFVNTLDPKNISHGNPALKPEKGDAMELGYSHNFEKGGSLNASVFYRSSFGDIQRYTVYYPFFQVGDSVYRNVSVTTPENVGTQRVFGLSLYGSVPLGEKVNVRTNLALFDRYIINNMDAGNNSNSFNYRVNLNASFQATKTLVAEFFGNFNSPHNELQGRYPSFTTYSFALRKLIWNKKGSIGFTTNNPFGKYVDQETELVGTNFTLNSLRRIPYRSFGISFSWKFGKLEFKKDKDDLEGKGGPDTN